jgi:hypothetical protein
MAGWISAEAMQNNAVATAAIQDLAITTAKIADAAVTLAKINAAKLLYTGVYGYAEYGRAVYG